MSDNNDDLNVEDNNQTTVTVEGETVDPDAIAESITEELKPKKDRYKQDLLEQKAANKKLQDEIASLRQDRENDRISKMKEQERFKELADEYESKARQAEEDNRNLRNAVMNDKKLSAVQQAAMKLGIRKEALVDLDMLSLDTVEIETTSTGRVNVLNADHFAENLKIQKPHWFGRRSSNFNTSEPEVVTGGSVTMDMIKKAEQEYKKTGDSTKYQALLMKYKQQSM